MPDIAVPLTLRQGDKQPLLPFLRTLQDSYGYTPTDFVTQAGQMKIAGGDITLWPIEAETAYRLEFFGNELENIHSLTTGLKQSAITVSPNLIVLDNTVIHPGEVLVHLGHGIGLFETRLIKRIQNEPRRYIQLGYADGGKLFVPEDRFDLLSRYIGFGRAPRLSKLGTQSWQRTRERVEHSVFALAKELLLIYAQRELKQVTPLKWEESWETILEASFPYELTKDQKTALEASLADLQRTRPMDRLIAGDVGFGKTEVAIRIAAAVVGAGYQAAILAPTTILVEQHEATFEQRLTGLPANLKRLSRFASHDEIKQALAGLKDGSVDVIVGTHRLLAEDVEFKRLGLVIIDEEQKFGVKQKERLKQLRLDVNILSLSATPIPRTLFMALSGIRDLSLIQTPPQNRLPIETTVLAISDQVIKRSIEREVARGGQAYLLHNDVQTMPARLKELQVLLPGVSIRIAHGQMAEEQLANVMRDFTLGQIDVLLCSTIIEAGLDLPNVNTLIVERAERFGLADLYQLRGRVGRSNRQAYALLMYTKHTLHGPAKERLQALADMTELGKGYEVALRDLEIRGGGNVLGREQHGNMEAIGLILYTKLLQQAVDRLKQLKHAMV